MSFSDFAMQFSGFVLSTASTPQQLFMYIFVLKLLQPNTPLLAWYAEWTPGVCYLWFHGCQPESYHEDNAQSRAPHQQ